MKILVADKIAASGVEYLKNQDTFEVIEAYDSSPEQILGLVGDVSAIIVRSDTQITREVIEAAPQLKAVGRAGVGVDNIDTEAATERGVVVMNTPGGNTIATAELTFTHMLCAARPIVQAGQSMREGKWDRKKYKGIELRGKKLGICGLGRIGAEVAARAKAFGMEILAYDPYLTEQRAQSLDVRKVDLDGLVAEADFITVHMPLTDETRGMIGKEQIAKAKDGVRLLNVARGGIIDEQAAYEGLESGKVGAVGMDVFVEEPPADDHPLRGHANAVLTPHLGASTVEAQEGVGIEVAEIITDLLLNGTVRNAINVPSVDANTLKVLKPYLALGERLGTAVQQISPGSVTFVRITYWGTIIELDAMPLTRNIQKGFLKAISGDGVNEVNARQAMKNLGIEGEVIKNENEADYNELIRVEAISADGTVTSIEGTLIGNTNRPRIVRVNGRDVEANLEKGYLMMLENTDTPGTIGFLGKVLGDAGLNIGNMSLSRNTIGGLAWSILTLDERPSPGTISQLLESDAIVGVHLVEI